MGAEGGPRIGSRANPRILPAPRGALLRMSPVRLTDPRLDYLRDEREIEVAIRAVLESGRYMLGPEVEGFERAFANFVGAQHAIGVASGTDAVALALLGCGLEPGDEVITVSHTAVATVAAIVNARGVPVLVDIDPDTMTMDVDSAARAVTRRTRAIVPVHLYGGAADITR